MSVSTVLVWLGFMVLFLVLNGLFVAVEFALIAMRKSRVQEMVDKGHPLGRTIKHLHDDIDTSIAGAQLGITLASLALGWIGEHSIQEAVTILMSYIPGATGFQIPAGTGFVVSFMVLSVLHVVIGEQVPKSWALRMPEQMVVWLAVPFRIFCLVTKPLIWAMNGIATLVLMVLRIPKASGEQHIVHSTEELGILIESSREAGTLEEEETDLLKRALELKALTVKEVMIPRTRMDRIADHLTLPEVLAVVSKTKHSKLPVVRGSDDNVVGILNTRDLFDWWHSSVKAATAGGGVAPAKEFKLSAFLRKVYFVPDSMAASDLLEEMRRRKIQMAIVVDEFGGTSGLVTLEDLLEQLVGEIWDEYDTPQPGVEKLGESGWRIAGDLTLLEFNKALGAELSCSSACITVAGAFVESLGRVPVEGDSLAMGGFRFTVAEMRLHGIAVMEVERLPSAPPALPTPDPAAGA